MPGHKHRRLLRAISLAGQPNDGLVHLPDFRCDIDQVRVAHHTTGARNIDNFLPQVLGTGAEGVQHRDQRDLVAGAVGTQRPNQFRIPGFRVRVVEDERHVGRASQMERLT